MDVYTDFASVYDIFMEEVPYEAWIAFLEEIWRRENLQPKTIADLGCGTGNVLLPLAQKGFDMIGVDVSSDMLCQAEQKLRQAGYSAQLLEQDLSAFALPMPVDCMISLCDSLNYLIEDGALSAAFSCVREYLTPEGIFLFDLNTEYKFREVLAQNTYAVTEAHAAYIWENYYDEAEKINEYAVNLFLEKTDGTYVRTEEFHYERAYSLEEVTAALAENGLRIVSLWEDYHWQTPKADSQRIVFVVKREK